MTPQRLSFLLTEAGRALATVGERDRARVAFEQALALDRRRRQLEGDTPDALRAEAIALTDLARVLLGAGDRAGAHAGFEESAKLRRRRQLEGDTPDALASEAVALADLAQVLMVQGNREDARTLLEEALDLFAGARDEEGVRFCEELQQLLE